MINRAFRLTPAVMIALLALIAQVHKFDVVSVKPSAGRGGRGAGKGTANDPSLFAIHNQTVKGMILHAYNLQEYQLIGGPSWIDNDRFDVDAKPEQPTPQDQMLLMFRSVLADRFGLVTHRDIRTMSAYSLTVAKGGPKFGPYFQLLKDGDPFPPAEGRLLLGGTLREFGVGLRRNMQSFDPSTGPVPPGTEVPPVIDHTGIAGSYSMRLDIGTQEDWPALLEHQLGLRLELHKEPIEVLIVDHVAKPTEN
jgi:uncharacterized protein (TIGR03435 family)